MWFDVTLQAEEDCTDVQQSYLDWGFGISMGRWQPVSAAHAAKLPQRSGDQPCSVLPPGTRLSLSAGSKPNHLIVQVAPPDMPPDSQLAAAADELLSEIPGFRKVTRKRRRPDAGTSAGAAAAAATANAAAAVAARSEEQCGLPFATG
jgi:hypothetical protein